MEEQRKQNVASHSIESEFVSYEQAVALKKLGFDEDCFAGYDTFGDLWIGYNSTDGIEYNPSYYNKAPLKQQVFRWFREKYYLFSSFVAYYKQESDEAVSFEREYMYHITGGYNEDGFTTYEEAEDSCIDKLIELAKQQDK